MASKFPPCLSRLSRTGNTETLSSYWRDISERASNKPSAKAQRTVGCHNSHGDVSGLTSVKVGENFAMIVWLFGNAQTWEETEGQACRGGVAIVSGDCQEMVGFGKKCLYRAKVSEDRHKEISLALESDRHRVTSDRAPEYL